MSRNYRWRALFPILQMTKNMSISELHKKTKGRVSLSTIRNWKTGKVSYPRFETMQIVLVSLGYTFDIVPNQKPQLASKKIATSKSNGKAHESVYTLN